MARSGLRGMSKVRKILRALPDNVTAEVKKEIAWVTAEVEKEAKARAPEDTGTLRKYITGKTGRDGMSAKIGLRTATAKRKAFYAHFIEFGTRGYNAGETRRVKNSKTTKKIYRNVAPQPARPFLFPAFENGRREFINRVQAAVNKALRRAARGDLSPAQGESGEGAADTEE